MKKAICLLLSVVIFAGLFSACTEKTPEPLRILVDADADEFAEYSCKAAVEIFLETIESLGGPGDVELEILPSHGTDRETALDRIRTEIMSGHGPDVFIVRCNRGVNARDLLFPIPEKAMANGLFMPLDDYIENAQFMEWEKQTKVIMDAGRDEYGQQMIPLVYTVPLTFYRESDVPGLKPGADTTWQDMLEDTSGVLATAATWQHRSWDEFNFMYSDGHYLDYILGDLADYRSDTLLFTEEELLQRVTEVIEMEKAYESGKIPEAPAHYQTRMHVGYDYDLNHGYPVGFWVETRSSETDSYRGIRFKDTQTMIPIYSDDGGVTATVSAFAAVNANTDRPEDAFFILDYLLSLPVQQNFDLYDVYFSAGEAGIPVHEDLMQRAYPLNSIFYLPNDNLAEYSRVREQITRVYFRGDLTDAFDDLYSECRSAYDRGEDIAQIVSEHYTILKMRMAE